MRGFSTREYFFQLFLDPGFVHHVLSVARRNETERRKSHAPPVDSHAFAEQYKQRVVSPFREGVALVISFGDDSFDSGI